MSGADESMACGPRGEPMALSASCSSVTMSTGNVISMQGVRRRAGQGSTAEVSCPRSRDGTGWDGVTGREDRVMGRDDWDTGRDGEGGTAEWTSGHCPAD